MPQVSLVSLLELDTSAEIAVCLDFKDLQSLLLVCRAAQESVIRDTFLLRALVILPPVKPQELTLCATFRTEIRERLTAFHLSEGRDVETVVTAYPRLTQIRLTETYCTTDGIAKLVDAPLLAELHLNKLSYVDTSPLGQLSLLKHLDLTGTVFVGELNAFIQLKVLVLDHTEVESIAFVTDMLQLEDLRLRNTSHLVDLSPLGLLGEHHCLASLDLSDKWDLDLVPLIEGSLPHTLRQLRVEGCVLCESDMELHEVFAAFTRLEVLSLDDTAPYGIEPHDWTMSCVTLRVLDIRDWKVEDITFLSECSQLEVLGINLTHALPLDILVALGRLVNLRDLTVEGGRVHDILEALPSLRSLSCVGNINWHSRTSYATGEAVAVTASSLRPHQALERICLPKFEEYSDMERLAPNIKHLEVQQTLSYRRLHELLAWPALRSLRITGERLPRNLVPIVVNALRSLEVLCINDEAPTQNPIKLKACSSRKIMALTLRNSRSFTADALFELTALETLDLSGWGVFKYAEALQRSSGLPHLRAITIDRTTSCAWLKALAATKLPMLVKIFHPEGNCRWNPSCC
ncbi:hypothetical protein Poli38472_004472 [Pythium oligandrum]|uniref:Uncharacterized protein n=1 Tax=Pythium oligandrum TaxID=41045 RepID=A0A8K1CAH3_PYTOL|nr:hypothetical protein Poli38472_004472 [Pythium oligandrum]|eukprot:TMW59403.1 hypothetical protein Poli38472_004472 [Pythium oligandrum]